MNTHTMVNGSIEMEYKTNKYRVKKLGLIEIFGLFEEEIKTEYMTRIQDMAKIMPENQRLWRKE